MITALSRVIIAWLEARTFLGKEEVYNPTEEVEGQISKAILTNAPIYGSLVLL